MTRIRHLTTVLALSCGPADPGPTTAPDALGASALAPADAPSAIVPAYALVSTGPTTARVLWVPAGHDRYAVQVRADAAAAWRTTTPTHADHADVDGLAEDHHVRVVALDALDQVVAHSIDFRFTPASAAPTTLRGRELLDARRPGWRHGPTTVEGTGPSPAVGTLVIRPIDPAEPHRLVDEVLSVTPTLGGWSATTRPYQAPDPVVGRQLAERVRTGVQVNLSRDGLPAGLPTTRPGHVGHCSSSGWGCLEVPASSAPTVTPAHEQQRTTPWATPASGSLSWSRTEQGVDFAATATGGVQVQFDYELDWWGLSVDRLAARTRPYADGQVTASFATDGSDALLEQTLLSLPSVLVAGAVPLTVYAEFGMAGIAEVESEQPVEGSWTGSASFSRTYEVGYRDQRFYGPEQIDDDATLGLTPIFPTSSRADVWVGFQATGGIGLFLFGGEVASASLSPTAGLVLHHESTDGTPCGQAQSIAHTRIDAGARLDASLSMAFFGDRTYRLAELRQPLLGWGRPLDLTLARQLPPDAEVTFRIRPRQDPGFPSTGPSPTATLQTFLDGVATAETASLENTRYRFQPAPGELSAGTTPTLGVWLPDAGPPGLLTAPGTCLSTSLTVEAR